MVKKKTKIQEGQEIFASNIGGWYSTPEPNLEKWIVVKANSSSFYAVPETDQDRTPYRFSQKDLTHTSRWGGDDYVVYLTEDEYWGMISRRKERKELRVKLKAKIDKMSLNGLRELDKHIS